MPANITVPRVPLLPLLYATAGLVADTIVNITASYGSSSKSGKLQFVGHAS